MKLELNCFNNHDSCRAGRLPCFSASGVGKEAHQQGHPRQGLPSAGTAVTPLSAVSLSHPQAGNAAGREEAIQEGVDSPFTILETQFPQLPVLQIHIPPGWQLEAIIMLGSLTLPHHTTAYLHYKKKKKKKKIVLGY